MIPIFPNIKKLELKDKEIIENFTKDYPPYSDYNFPSMYSYNTENLAAFSFLNDNLVLLYTDYLTNLPFYSFLGTNKSIQTTITLLYEAKKNNFTKSLKLIPESSITKELSKHLHLEINEDRDNFDYILSIEELSSLTRKHYNKKKQLVQFEKIYPEKYIKLLNLKHENTQNEVLSLVYEWQKEKEQSEEDTKTEITAIKRIINSALDLNILAVGIYLHNKLIGFSIADTSTKTQAEFHFVKALKEYKGVYAALYIYLARELKKRGYTFMNIEQDLGIRGLRESKLQWHPVNYLKKFTIKLK